MKRVILSSALALGAMATFAWGAATVKYRLFPYSAIAAATGYKAPTIEARRAYLNGKNTRSDLVFVGDSIFQSIEWGEEFPGALNRGIQMDTTRDVIARLPSLKQIGAGTYVIMLGTNDIITGLPEDETARNIQAIVDALPGRKVLMSITPCSTDYGECDSIKIERLNNRLSAIAGAKFVRSKLDGTSDLADKVHPNANGMAKLVESVRPHVES